MSESAVLQTIDHRLARQREQARLRQARKRHRDASRVTTDAIVTDSNGHASVRLTKLAHALASGLPEAEALRSIGASVNSRGLAKMDSVQVAIKEILRKQRVTVERVAKNIDKRMDATSPMFTQDGCIEKPDWTAQASGCRDAIALLDRAGELPAASQSHTGTQITVNIVRFNAAPPDVVNEAIEAKSFTSETDVSNEKD